MKETLIFRNNWQQGYQ